MVTSLDSGEFTAAAFLVDGNDGSWCAIYPLSRRRPLTIGRSGRNAVVVGHDRCSRHHCEILWRRNHWIVLDLDSSNGTYVNGQRIENSHRVTMGDELRIADRVFRLTSSVVEIDGESQDASRDQCLPDNLTSTLFEQETSASEPGINE